MNTPIELLKKYWGYSEFRPPQEAIINSVLDKKDTIVLMPTGGGKSVCFQLPILLNDGICIVVSPLIALMNDQIKNLNQKGIKALALTSKLTQNELVTTFDNLQFGNYKFLYISPEKLQTPLVLEKIKHLNVQLIAIDEAHCISEWGHDFRPSYLQVKVLKEIFPAVPVIALTASATKIVLKDIIEQLNIERPKVFRKSYYRENLAYQIFDVEDKLYHIERILKKTTGVKIIYVNTRRKTVELSSQLNSMGYNSCFYHGGLNYDEKTVTFDSWISEKIPIIVATNAFGMGIDKPNVRVVIHYDIPKSIENYMQEAGRAGRDGKKAYAAVLKNKSDIHLTYQTFSKSIATVPFIKEVYFKLNQYFRIAYGELLEKSFEFNLPEFCNLYKFSPVTTFNALNTLEKEGIIILIENTNRKSSLLFKVQNAVLFTYYERNPSQEKLIKLILRTYGGIFETYKKINENFLSDRLGLSKRVLIQNLKNLERDGLLSYFNSNAPTHIQFLVPREDNITINIHARNIENRTILRKEKIDKLIDFMQNKKSCRNVQLLTYFNELDAKECGICDVCLSKKKTANKNIKLPIDEILAAIDQASDLSSKELAMGLNYSEKEIIFCLQLLLEKNRITVTSQNKYRVLE
jgi:ATP-dependent DNA helicase RecQ